jgi:hypothetical protein
MSDQGFTRLRNGLLEHVEEGKFTLRTYGLYTYLHQRKHWLSGVCWTNAQSIATTFMEKKSTVQYDMRVLRDRGYIQYPVGFGKKGSYPVLLVNDQPTHGVLKGYSLSGFTDKTYEYVYYEPLNGRHTEVVLSLWGAYAETKLTLGGSCALVVPLLDIRQSRLLNREDESGKIELYGETPGTQSLAPVSQVKKVGV